MKKHMKYIAIGIVLAAAVIVAIVLLFRPNQQAAADPSASAVAVSSDAAPEAEVHEDDSVPNEAPDSSGSEDDSFTPLEVEDEYTIEVEDGYGEASG